MNGAGSLLLIYWVLFTLRQGFYSRVQRQIKAVSYDLANKNISPKAGRIKRCLLQIAKCLLLAGVQTCALPISVANCKMFASGWRLFRNGLAYIVAVMVGMFFLVCVLIALPL